MKTPTRKQGGTDSVTAAVLRDTFTVNVSLGDVGPSCHILNDILPLCVMGSMDRVFASFNLIRRGLLLFFFLFLLFVIQRIKFIQTSHTPHLRAS